MESAINETVNERLKREAAQRRSGITRRRLLGKAGAALAAEAIDQATGGHVTKAILEIVGIGKETPITQPRDLVQMLIELKANPDPSKQKEVPTMLFKGNTMINKSSILRDSMDPGEDIIGPHSSNTVSWENIAKVNGTDVTGLNKFLVKNMPYAEGYNMDIHAPSGGNWGLLMITFKDGSEQIKFLADSATAEQEGRIVPDRNTGSFMEIESIDRDGIGLKRLPKIDRKDVGVVAPLVKAS